MMEKNHWVYLITRGPKGHISCTWVQCATFIVRSDKTSMLYVVPIGPKNTKLGRGCWDLASYQVSLNSVQRFHGRSRKCLGQSEAMIAILFFGSARKKHKLGRGCWDVAFCQVSANSVQQFKKRSRKCGKLKTYGGADDESMIDNAWSQ